MADKGQRTEQPTPKHIKEAHREGKFAKSSDLGSWLSFMLVIFLLPTIAQRSASQIINFLASAFSAMGTAAPMQTVGLLGKGLYTVLDAAFLPIVLIGTVGIISSLAQTKMKLSPGVLGFKWKKVSPLTGIKRIFSPSGLWELVKNLIRLFLLLGIGYETMHVIAIQILSPANANLSFTLNNTSSMLLVALRALSLMAFILSLFDYVFQRRRYNQSMKMTKEEVKRELREQEGSPEVKRALRRRRRRVSRLQLLAALKETNVVVVNPTHYSVALRYDKTKDKAPKVLSKGEDEDALAIRYEAIRLHIPIVENPPLARILYDTCEINTEVSVELYQRVAKLFAFVYSLSPAAKQLIDVHKMAYSQ